MLPGMSLANEFLGVSSSSRSRRLSFPKLSIWPSRTGLMLHRETVGKLRVPDEMTTCEVVLKAM